MKSKNKNEIVVIGQTIQTKIEELDIYNLHFWKENPRVNAIIKQNYNEKTPSDEEIENELWEKESVKDLFKEIERHEGLIDEIFVKDNVVLEGNSRLCAYRRLHKRALLKKDDEEILKWSFIRARILPKDTSDEVILSILGTWHIKGKTQWDTYEKAAYLKRMHIQHNQSLKKIGETISESEKFVKDHIEAYDLMVTNNVFTLEKFSYFYELVKNKRIREITDKEPKLFDKLINTIIDNQYKRGEEIRDLPKVLNDKKARKLFLDEKWSFNEAFEISKNRHPEHDDNFYNQVKKLTKTINECTLVKIEEIKKDGNKQYLFKNFSKN